MRFPQDFIEKVRESNNVAEIIGQHTELKGSGHRLMGRCPFPDHSDKSPSFSVTEDNQLYFCYGCKKGGNVFTFLETFNGMSFPEAVEFLARRASIPLPEGEQRGRKGGLTGDQKDLYLKINKAAGVFFHQQLKSESEDSPVRKYLVKRGLSEEIVDKFRLGVTFDDWQGLYHHFQARKVPVAAAETLGLVKPKKGGREGDSHFDLFRDRLMFPIFSPSNDVVGFGGRTLGDALPKYVNSSDSPVFSKGKILYGLHETGKFIRAQDEVIVVEGYMDAISLYAAGIKNVVAILGTAFTPEHAKLVKRYTLNVKMLLDGDEAGISGAERSLPILLEAGLMPKGFVLPEKMDPDDFVKERGADALRLEIERAGELFTLLLTKRWLQNYHGTPSDKVRVVEEAAGAMKGMQNRQLMDLYILELSRQLDIDMNWVRRALAQSSSSQAPGQTSGAAANIGSQGPTPNQNSGSVVGNRPIPVGGSRQVADSRVAASSRSAAGAAGGHSTSAGNIRSTSAFVSGGSTRPVAGLSVTPSAVLPGASGPLGEEPPMSTEPYSSEAFMDMEAAMNSSLGMGSSSPFEMENDDEPVAPLILLKGAPKDEAFVLSVFLYNEGLLQELVEKGPDETLKVLSHSGVRQALAEAVRMYAAKPNSFSGLAASLASRVDLPGLLGIAVPLIPADAKEGTAKILLNDYVAALDRRRLDRELKLKQKELKDQWTPEKMQEFMKLQRERSAPKSE